MATIAVGELGGGKNREWGVERGEGEREEMKGLKGENRRREGKEG